MVEKLPPIHPGEILREEYLKPLRLTGNRLATALHVPPQRINEIVNERRAISADTALRLSRYFDTTPAFWMGLQAAYELELAAFETGAEIATIRPRSGAIDAALGGKH